MKKVYRKLFIPQLRADHELLENYRYQDGIKLDCPITAFAGNGEQNIGEEKLQGWAIHTCSKFHAKRFPGEHLFLHSSENQVLKAIGHELTSMVKKLKNDTTRADHQEWH